MCGALTRRGGRNGFVLDEDQQRLRNVRPSSPWLHGGGREAAKNGGLPGEGWTRSSSNKPLTKPQPRTPRADVCVSQYQRRTLHKANGSGSHGVGTQKDPLRSAAPSSGTKVAIIYNSCIIKVYQDVIKNCDMILKTQTQVL